MREEKKFAGGSCIAAVVKITLKNYERRVLFDYPVTQRSSATY